MPLPLLRGALAVPQAAVAYPITQNDIDTLVSLSEAHGIDPNDVAAVLVIESGFNPASLGPGSTGAHTGLNQMSVANLATYGIAPIDWVSMSAAEQLPTVFKFWSSLNSLNGGQFASNAATLAALNILPGLYKNTGAKNNPNVAITSNPSIYYTSNTWYDPGHTGSISLNTIAQRIALVEASDPTWKKINTMIGGSGPVAPPIPINPINPISRQSGSDVVTALVRGLLLGGTAFLLKREIDLYRRPRKRTRRRAA